MYRNRVIALVLGMALLAGAGLGVAGIANTKHNLSVSGSGTYKATSETQLCVYCHTPHNASPSAPLWNHAMSAATYTPYGSTTLAAAAPGQPTGSAKLCLSCHDGTVALGSVQMKPFSYTAGVITGLEAFLTGTSSLGTDLRNDHPVSFTYDATLSTTNPELVNPTGLTGRIKPDSTNQLQCTSCHDPHSDTYPKFLHLDFTDGAGYGSPLCRTCHSKAFWSTVANMAHREQTKPWNGAGVNPWHVPGHNLANDPVNSTNKANGCESCHQPHNAAGVKRLLKQDGEANVCLVCHNGNVATTWNIDSVLNRFYTHPVKDATRSGRHNPKRQTDGTVREDPADLNNRHAICQDCHNPHAVSAGVSPNASPSTTTTNLASNVLKGVWGVQPSWPGNWSAVTSYTVTNDVQYQYQLCLKCHSYYAYGASPPTSLDSSKIVGGLDTDQAKEFNPSNKSYHPVVQQGNNAFLATLSTGMTDYPLINGMTKTSVIGCTDCHSDTEPGFSGSKGPHGASYWPILWGRWDYTSPPPTDLLCYKCHKPEIYGGLGTSSDPLRGTSSTGFVGSGSWSTCSGGGGGGSRNLHNWHAGCKQFPCMVCHSAVPHGWQRRAMLVYRQDTGPYNSHSQYSIGGTTDYGIPSSLNLDTVTSGSWSKSYCHSQNANNC